MFENANDLLGFRISDVLFGGTESDLKETKVTQPAVFLHSAIGFSMLENPQPDMVAGHSLGEFSAQTSRLPTVCHRLVDIPSFPHHPPHV